MRKNIYHVVIFYCVSFFGEIFHVVFFFGANGCPCAVLAAATYLTTEEEGGGGGAGGKPDRTASHTNGAAGLMLPARDFFEYKQTCPPPLTHAPLSARTKKGARAVACHKKGCWPGWGVEYVVQSPLWERVINMMMFADLLTSSFV